MLAARAASAWRKGPTGTARAERCIGLLPGCALLFAAVLALPPLARAAGDGIDELKAAYRRPAETPFPKDNPYSQAKAELGKSLFFDPRLSGPGTISCASCHNPLLGWSDALAVATGAGGQKLRRRSPSLLNGAWARALMWDGRFATLEEQAMAPMLAPNEMNQTVPELASRLKAMPGYDRVFEAIFPGEGVSEKTIAKAIAAFERTMVSEKAPFDRWIEGEENAINSGAKRGFLLFNGKARCAACHTGWRFTDDSFHDIGLKSEDLGRGALKPNIPVLQHAFKTPGLRNIALRTPYMHDGSIATLSDVMREYNDGFVERTSLSPEMKRLHLSEVEMSDVVAFLATLTSEDKPVSMPALPVKEVR